MHFQRILLYTLLIGIGVSIVGAPPLLFAEDSDHKHQHGAHEKELWCKEHNMPEKRCFICHPELREKGRLWCNEHGRYEDRCWLCHPDLEDKERPYCKKHFLYLDECQHLHPELSGKKQVDHSHKHDHAKKELWCKEHDMPEEECFICHPELREKGRLWCKEHGRYEDRCWLCHPDLEEKDRPYCEKHFLYLDECKHLHPELEGEKTNVSQKAPTKASPALYCKEHDLPEKECGLCHPELLAAEMDGSTLKVRLPSKDSPELVGIKTVNPKSSDLGKTIRALGEIKFNQNRTVHLVAPVHGVIKNVYVDLGTEAEEGQKLLSMWSPAIGEAASEAVLAEQTLTRVKRLRKKSISSAGDLDKAEAKYRAALQRLKSFGFSDEQLETLGDDPSAPITLTMTAPFASEVVARDAVNGEYVETGHPVFTLSDRSVMWAILNLSEKHLGSVAVGQRVMVHTRAFPDEEFYGEITHVSASIDSKTRMAVVRASVENSSGKLRENMFVRAEIEQQEQKHVLLVPAHSVQNVSGTNVAFAELDKDLYEVRPVTLGSRVGEYMQVFTGLKVSDRVVSDGSQAVKSHFLISRLGAGCVD